MLKKRIIGPGLRHKDRFSDTLVLNNKEKEICKYSLKEYLQKVDE